MRFLSAAVEPAHADGVRQEHARRTRGDELVPTLDEAGEHGHGVQLPQETLVDLVARAQVPQRAAHVRHDRQRRRAQEAEEHLSASGMIFGDIYFVEIAPT